MADPDICIDTLRSRYRYDKDTGVFWSIPSGKSTLSQGPQCRLLGSKNIVLGYVVIGAMRHHFYAHRLAWFYVTGKWPAGQIDHINGDRADNRFCNLRDVSDGVNKQNRRKAQADNKCGFLGVCWNKKSKKWSAEVKTAGQRVYAGRFETPEQAHAAYLEAKRRLHVGCTI